MEGLLHVLGLLALFAVCLFGLFSLLLGLPGTVIIVLAAFVYAWATGFSLITWGTLGWLVLLTIVGEGLEFFAGMVGAASERPSRRVLVATLVGGFIGGILGAPLLFGIGALIGALAGAFIGAAAAAISEGQSHESALRIGFAAMRGRLLGFVLKSVVAVVMVLLIVSGLSW